MRILISTPKRWLQRLRLLLLLLVVLPVVPGSSVYAEGAADAGIAGEWEITFEIRSGKVYAFWIGRVWDYDENGNGELLETRIEDISDDCQSSGNPVFRTRTVTFDGKDDYIRCIIPNFQVIFAQMHPDLVNCYCTFASPPYAAADVSPVYSTEPLPVVYHDRLHLEVMSVDTESLRFPIIKTNFSKPTLGKPQNIIRDAARVDANNSLGLVRLTLHFPNLETQSWQSNLSNVWHKNGFQIWAGYDATRFATNTSQTGWAKFLADNGFWDEVAPEDEVPPEYNDGFFMWETDAISKYDKEEMPPGFLLGPLTPLYIGYNPITETYFDGTIRTLAVDPGCRGH